MSHSLINADRGTHFKVVAVALVGAILLVICGLLARTENSEVANARLHDPVLKAGKSTTVTTREAPTIR